MAQRSKPSARGVLLTVVAFLTLSHQQAFADPIWNQTGGLTTVNWSNPANWNTGVVPISTDNPILALSNFSHYLDANTNVASLTMNGQNSTLNTAGYTLGVSGNVDLLGNTNSLSLTPASTMTVGGNLNNTNLATLTLDTSTAGVTGTVTNDSSTITLSNGSIMTVGGDLNNLSTNISGNGLLNVSGGSQLTVSGTLSFDNSAVYLNGLPSVLGAGSVTNTNGSGFNVINGGAANVTGDFTNSSGALGGSQVDVESSGSVNVTGAFINLAGANQNQVSLSNQGALTAGTLDNQAGNAIFIASGGTLQVGTQLTNSGSLTMDSHSDNSSVTAGVIGNSGTLTANGTDANFGAGRNTVTTAYLLNDASGVVTVGGGVNGGLGAQLNVVAFVNSGTVVVNGPQDSGNGSGGGGLNADLFYDNILGGQTTIDAGGTLSVGFLTDQGFVGELYGQDSAGSETNVNGTQIAGVVDIANGILEGNGTIDANVLIEGDGVISPGNSPGTLNINGNYTQSSTGTMDIELGNLGAGNFDQIVVTGNVTLDGILQATFLPGYGYTPVAGDIFVILLWTGSESGDFSAFNWTIPGGSGGLVLQEFIDAQNQDLYLEWVGEEVAVPEPASLFLLGAGLASLLAARRKRQAN